MVTAITHKQWIDLDVSGKFDDDPLKDISEYTKSLKYTRGSSKELNTSDVGYSEVELMDPTYQFVPENTASALYPNVVAGRPLKIQGLLDSTDTVQDNPLSATAIELNVSDGSNFAVGDVIKIENELMRIWMADMEADR